MKELRPRFRRLQWGDCLSESDLKKLEEKKRAEILTKIRSKLKKGYCLFIDLKEGERFEVKMQKNRLGKFEKRRIDPEDAWAYNGSEVNAVCLTCGSETFVADFQVVKKFLKK